MVSPIKRDLDPLSLEQLSGYRELKSKPAPRQRWRSRGDGPRGKSIEVRFFLVQSMSPTNSFDFEDIKARFPNRFGYCLQRKLLTISQAIGRKDEIG